MVPLHLAKQGLLYFTPSAPQTMFSSLVHLHGLGLGAGLLRFAAAPPASRSAAQVGVRDCWQGTQYYKLSCQRPVAWDFLRARNPKWRRILV